MSKVRDFKENEIIWGSERREKEIGTLKSHEPHRWICVSHIWRLEDFLDELNTFCVTSVTVTLMSTPSKQVKIYFFLCILLSVLTLSWLLSSGEYIPFSSQTGISDRLDHQICRFLLGWLAIRGHFHLDVAFYEFPYKPDNPAIRKLTGFDQKRPELTTAKFGANSVRFVLIVT